MVVGGARKRRRGRRRRLGRIWICMVQLVLVGKVEMGWREIGQKTISWGLGRR